MSNLTITQQQYEALVSLARKGVTDPDGKRQLEAFLQDIERTNSITRYFLKVRWQELNSPLPPGVTFPTSWPPELEMDLESTVRPIARADVNKALSERAKNPTNVMVTRDPGGIVGWTKLADFFK